MIRVGVSGWTYPAWRKHFYPKGVTQKRELEWASRQLSLIEINGTFYSLQKPTSFQRWYAETPESFQFAIKGGQFITHVRRLKDLGSAVPNFFACGLLALKEKLGPILWQFPPNMKLKDDRFEKFIAALPKNFKQAAEVGSRHHEFMTGNTYLEVEKNYPIRYAFEFRHPSFDDKAFLSLLKANGIAAVYVHSGAYAPPIETQTADFTYARLHGMEEKYAKGYPPAFLKEFAKKVKGWTRGKRDVFAIFNNEAKEKAPKHAQDLQALVTKTAGAKTAKLRRAG